MKTYVLLSPEDTVVTALVQLDQGTVLSVDNDAASIDLVVSSLIPYAHKIALRPMAIGQNVIKYGEVIGVASQPISPGDWVHVHNVESVRARGDVV